MKTKKFLCIFCVTVMLLMAASVLGAGANSSYQTYTYSYEGDVLYSPDAYTPDTVIDYTAMGLDTPIVKPSDLYADADGNVYIADTDNSRIVCLDRYYKVRFILKNFRNEQGNADHLESPQGLYVANGKIWVADTGKNRIAVFDMAGNFERVVRQPESQLFDEGAIYKPIALAVDAYNRLYVVSSTTYQGIIVMTEKGEFTQFVGAQSVEVSAWTRIWKRFQSDQQKEYAQTIISTEYNNITINEKGIIYATTSSIADATVEAQILAGTKTGTYSPVKMINATGTEIMRRNGFWVPYGEIDYMSTSTDASQITGVSKLVDVAIGPARTWSIIDEKRSRIYTYDYNGNLLFAFGDVSVNNATSDTGKMTMLGNITQNAIRAITYQGDVMLVLDSATGAFTVYKRTEYGDLLIRALEAENNQEYDTAIQLWQDVLKRNSNFDSAYIGIGQAMYRSGDYEGSLDYFKAAYDVENYSNSFKEIRTQFMSKWFLLLMAGIVAVIVGVVFFFRWAGKVNKRAATRGGKKTFKEEFLYVFHVIFHPFDGFWDLKHEKRGSLRAAFLIDAIVVVAFYYQSIGRGYIANPHATYSSIISQLLGIMVPLLLFVLANWCLTTLFDGEGSFKDIFIVCSYSLMPLVLLIVPGTIFTNFCLESELNIVTLLTTVAFIWMALLVIFGTQVTHDYSTGKNILMLLCTILGMVCIMFIAVLFSTLVGKLVSLVTNIVTEIQFRL